MSDTTTPSTPEPTVLEQFHAHVSALHWSLVIPQRVAGTASYLVNGKAGRRYHFLQRGNEFVKEFGTDFKAFEEAMRDMLTSGFRQQRSYPILVRVEPPGGFPKVAPEMVHVPTAPATDPAELARVEALARRSKREGQLLRMEPYDLQPIVEGYGLDVARHGPKRPMVEAIIRHEFGAAPEAEEAEGRGAKGEGGEGERSEEHRTSNIEHPTSNVGAAYSAESLGKMEWNALKAFAAGKGVTARTKAEIVAQLLELLPADAAAKAA